MILAGLVAEPIVFTDWDLIDLPEHQRRWLDLVVAPYRPAEIVPYLEVLAVDGFGERRYIVRPLVPCVTALP